MENTEKHTDNIVIDPEFEALIPPLQAKEYELLEQSILKEGCRDPITVWQYNDQSFILDGHHRFKICTTHNVLFPITYISEDAIPNREAAQDWIDANQLARRNLARKQYALILGRLYNRTKHSHGGERASSGQNDRLKTSEKLAKDTGVSEATVRRAGKFAESVSELKDVDQDIEQKIIQGEGPSQKKVIEAAEHLKKQNHQQDDKQKHPSQTPEQSLELFFSSQSNEWNTPPVIIEPVLKILGTVDLDPCSNSKQHPNIPASKHIVEPEDGLKQKWEGRVYLNPPCGQDIIKWVEKLHREYESRNITEALSLLPARTDTSWFRTLREYPKCFISGRLKFSDSKNAAPFPSMVVYLGANSMKFCQVFSELGDIYTLIRLEKRKLLAFKSMLGKSEAH